jgi:hypothetical protein
VEPKQELIESMSDLRLAEVLNVTWSQLFQLQNQVQAIQTEINKRKEKPLVEGSDLPKKVKE